MVAKSPHSSPSETIKKLYYQRLDSLSISYELITIETSFGDTNIITTGHKKDPPMVLLHGINSNAPLALSSLKVLLPKFAIYAIDIVGHPNLSERSFPNMQDNSFGQWIYEILGRLNIWNATLVGFSFGGFVAWKTLLFDSKRFTKAFLIMPAGIVRGRLFHIILRLCMSIKIYQWSNQIIFLKYFLSVLYTKPTLYLQELLPNVFANYKITFGKTPLIRAAQAQKINTPINIVAARRDVLFPGIRLLKRAQSIFPSLDEVLLLENSRHVSGCLENEQIAQFIENNYKK